ncbi:bone marrow proteoglycan-like [Strix uralensis]|uniref:bone marrow proteoglycan-like n=1 Tax=Strix uralensis TaxID=36305 RepID=UPI003DA31F5D
MQPCLLLVLALLGSVSASRPSECPLPCSPCGDTTGAPPTALGPPVPALTLSPGPAPLHPQEVPASTAKEGHNFVYTVVKKYRTYSSAKVRGTWVLVGGGGWQWVLVGAQPCLVPQLHCQKVLRGQLASVHSAARNTELKNLARTYTHHSVWIGAVTKRRDGKWGSQWEDTSPWNYANWAPTHPHHILPTCTALSTHDGLWRSKPCFQLRPFICQY